jgi:hypothetical protein
MCLYTGFLSLNRKFDVKSTVPKHTRYTSLEHLRNENKINLNFKNQVFWYITPRRKINGVSGDFIASILGVQEVQQAVPKT